MPSAPPPPSSQLAKQKASGVSNSKGNLLRILKRSYRPFLRERKRRIKEGVLGVATAKRGVGELCLQPLTPGIQYVCPTYAGVCPPSHMPCLGPLYTGPDVVCPHHFPVRPGVCISPNIYPSMCIPDIYPRVLSPLPVCITLGPPCGVWFPSHMSWGGGYPGHSPVRVFPLPMYTYG